MSVETNKMAVNMGILTSAKDDLLRKYYDKIVESPVDIRLAYKRLSKKKIDNDIIWGLIGCIGVAELTEEEFNMLEGWMDIGSIYFDDKTMHSLIIHLDRGIKTYAKSKGIEELDEGEESYKEFDFEEYIKRFEVNSIIIRIDYKLYHVGYNGGDVLTISDRFKGEKAEIEGIVFKDEKIIPITKGSDTTMIKDKTIYKIV